MRREVREDRGAAKHIRKIDLWIGRSELVEGVCNPIISHKKNTCFAKMINVHPVFAASTSLSLSSTYWEVFCAAD